MKIHSPPPHSITVHILHDNTLTLDNRDKFIYVAGRYNQRVEFHNVEVLCADKIQKISDTFPKVIASNLSIATFYRFCIAQVLPADIDKVIYLDSDIIVNLDIAELWRIDLDNKPLGVVRTVSQKLNPDLSVENIFGFNAGVLLMNLKYLRQAEEVIATGIKFIAANPEYKLFDQDVLNHCFAAESLQLPVKFNRLVKWCRRQKEQHIGKKIYHYNGFVSTRTFGLDMSDPFNRLWMSYFIKTPWFDAETIGRMYAGVRQVHAELKQEMIKVSAMVSGKTRAFFVLPEDIDGLKEIFFVRDNEEIIPVESDESLITLLNAMNVSRGRKIFFIMIRKFPFEVLTEAGFVRDEDFVDGADFLSEEYGVPLNSYPLIQAM